MIKIGRNDRCPCGSGMKYKKCCLDKKPRERVIMVGSPEPLCGLDYDKEKMEHTGLTVNGRSIEPVVTFSQMHYKTDSGKEKVEYRIHDKVIPDEAELMRYLSSSFDLIIGVDTNTKTIGSETISVTGTVHCVVHSIPEPDTYSADFPEHGVILFRNCPNELPSEKFGWISEIQRINHAPQSKAKKYALVTDHDLDNHISYNDKQKPIFKNFYLPDNFKLVYGRGDGPTQNLLNYIVKQCDKESNEVLSAIEQNGYYQNGDRKIAINEIPVPRF